VEEVALEEVQDPPGLGPGVPPLPGEEAQDLHPGPRGGGDGPQLHPLPPGQKKPPAHLAPGPGADLKRGRLPQGVKRLAAEAQGGDPLQVLELTGGEGLHGQGKLFHGNPLPVVLHHDPFKPPAPKLHPHPPGPGVQGVFQKLPDGVLDGEEDLSPGEKPP
jgi:hypothetical protein